MTGEAWTEVSTAHPEVAEFRNAPFEFAVQMHQALAGKVAKFEHAVTVTNLQAELSGTPKSHKVPVRSGDKRRRSGGRVGVSEAGGRAPETPMQQLPMASVLFAHIIWRLRRKT